MRPSNRAAASATLLPHLPRPTIHKLRTMIKSVVKSIHSKLVFDRRTDVLAREISRLIPEGASILDVGTGDGRVASLMGHRVPSVDVEGIDLFVRDKTHIPVHHFDG